MMEMSYLMKEGGGSLPSFLVQIFLFLAARLISVQISQNKIKLNFNYLFMTSNNLNK